MARSLSAGEAVPSLRGHVVRLRGLPFTSTAQDVLDFFSGVEVMGGEAGVLFTCTPEGRPTGEAYLELASEEGQQAALARHKESIGSRYIEIFQSSKGDLYQAVQQHGFFTAVGGRRKHQWHQQHGGGAGGPHGGGEAAAGGHGARVLDRGQAGVDEMAAAFAGFGFSQRDMQVPGPPRYGFGYASTPDDRHLVGRPSPPGTMSASQAWQQQAAMQQQQQRSMQMRAAMQQQFNPAPGPPGKVQLLQLCCCSNNHVCFPPTIDPRPQPPPYLLVACCGLGQPYTPPNPARWVLVRSLVGAAAWLAAAAPNCTITAVSRRPSWSTHSWCSTPS